MKKRLFALFITLLLVAAACQGPPATQVVLVVTATPDPESSPEVTVLVVTATPEAGTSSAAVATGSGTTTSAQAAANATSTATATIAATMPRPSATPTMAFFPTPTITQIQVAEQVFERGRMFWIQPRSQIWVMIAEPDVAGRGEWQVYADSWQEGDPALDPALTPPEDLFQPERGFGKLWRENSELQEALGWAVTPEFGFVTRYEYYPNVQVENGQVVLTNGTPTPLPGYHVLVSLYNEAFRFNELDSTWQLNN